MVIYLHFYWPVLPELWVIYNPYQISYTFLSLEMICILQDVTKTISLLVYSFKWFQTKYAPALAVAAFLATETNTSTKYLVYNVQREQGTRSDSTTSTLSL